MHAIPSPKEAQKEHRMQVVKDLVEADRFNEGCGTRLVVFGFGILGHFRIAGQGTKLGDGFAGSGPRKQMVPCRCC